MSEIDPKTLRARLLARKADVATLDDAGGQARAPVQLDQTRVGRLSRMDALQGQALAKATHERRKQELRRIEAALDRLEAGEYGICVRCGEEISPRRLESDPAIAICIDCAEGLG